MNFNFTQNYTERKTKLHKTKLFLCLFVFLSVFICVKVSAEGSLTLSIPPPLFKINLGPGESWQSGVKIVNANPVSKDMFVSVVDFEPIGESGQGRLVPILEDSGKESLAKWVRVSKEPVRVPPEGGGKTPCPIANPDGASPGGHYAAIVVGTEPAKEEG